MMTTLLRFVFATALLMTMFSCSKEEEIAGCTDPDSLTYIETANLDDGSCIYLDDLFIGDWKVNNFYYDGYDLTIENNVLQFSNLTFEFKSNKEFQVLGRVTNHQNGASDNIISNGSWETSFSKLIIKSDFFSSICPTKFHNFKYEFDTNTFRELTMEITCNSGLFLRVILERTR